LELKHWWIKLDLNLQDLNHVRGSTFGLRYWKDQKNYTYFKSNTFWEEIEVLT
jgi:hypothetical protein